jgi:hypothetical protein
VILLCDWFRSDAGCENRIVEGKKLLKQVTPSRRQHTITNNEKNGEDEREREIGILAAITVLHIRVEYWEGIRVKGYCGLHIPSSSPCAHILTGSFLAES